jgi:hypothetical protein
MNASKKLEDDILNYFFRNQAVTRPSSHFLALYTSNPTDNNTGTQVTGGGYVRMPITFSTISTVGGKSTVSNTAEIRFPIATANWGNVSHFGVLDALTGGNLLAHGAVPVPKMIENGDEAKFNAGTLTISMD